VDVSDKWGAQMSRYIDADALECDTEWSEYHDGFTAYSQMAIDTAPSVDLVWCIECRWYLGLAECELIGDCAGTYGFCAWGERKEGE